MSIKDEHIGFWLFVALVSLIGSVTLSFLLIGASYERLAKILFLGLPSIALTIFKFFERPMLRRYCEYGDHGQWVIRKDAPRSVNILFKLIPIMVTLMIGYAYAHLAKYGSI